MLKYLPTRLKKEKKRELPTQKILNSLKNSSRDVPPDIFPVYSSKLV